LPYTARYSMQEGWFQTNSMHGIDYQVDCTSPWKVTRTADFTLSEFHSWFIKRSYICYVALTINPHPLTALPEGKIHLWSVPRASAHEIMDAEQRQRKLSSPCSKVHGHSFWGADGDRAQKVDKKDLREAVLRLQNSGLFEGEGSKLINFT